MDLRVERGKQGLRKFMAAGEMTFKYWRHNNTNYDRWGKQFELCSQEHVDGIHEFLLPMIGSLGAKDKQVVLDWLVEKQHEVINYED